MSKPIDEFIVNLFYLFFFYQFLWHGEIIILRKKEKKKTKGVTKVDRQCAAAAVTLAGYNKIEFLHGDNFQNKWCFSLKKKNILWKNETFQTTHSGYENDT